MFSDIKDFTEQIKMGGFVGLAQINPIAGNLEYNVQKITEFIKFFTKNKRGYTYYWRW